jgi:hypothetical protein
MAPRKDPAVLVESFQTWNFPLSGIYVTSEFERPPPQTGELGINVRACESIKFRLRGGSRPGLQKYIPTAAVSDEDYIQMLNIIIDPNAAFIGGNPGTAVRGDAVGRNLIGGLGGYQPVQFPTGDSINYNVKPTITITALDQEKNYGDVFTFNGNEFKVDGNLGILDSVTSVTLTCAGSPASASVDGSPYDIVPSKAKGSGLGNYNIKYANGKMTVDSVPLTITANDLQKMQGNTVVFKSVNGSNTWQEISQYDGSVLNSGVAYTVSGLVGKDKISSVPIVSDGAAADADPGWTPDGTLGLYDIVPAAATGTPFNPDNYTINYVHGTLGVKFPQVYWFHANSAAALADDTNPTGTLNFNFTPGTDYPTFLLVMVSVWPPDAKITITDGKGTAFSSVIASGRNGGTDTNTELGFRVGTELFQGATWPKASSFPPPNNVAIKVDRSASLDPGMGYTMFVSVWQINLLFVNAVSTLSTQQQAVDGGGSTLAQNTANVNGKLTLAGFAFSNGQANDGTSIPKGDPVSMTNPYFITFYVNDALQQPTGPLNPNGRGFSGYIALWMPDSNTPPNQVFSVFAYPPDGMHWRALTATFDIGNYKVN